MTTEENSVTEQDPVNPSVGEILSSAREARQFSLEYVASKLKLSTRQLVALEKDDFAALPGNTFVRGFVRNYARLLQIEPQPLLDQLSAVLPAERVQVAMPKVPDATALSSFSVGNSAKQTGLWAMVVLGLLLGCGLVYWYLQLPVTPDLVVSKPTELIIEPVPSVLEASEVAAVASEVEATPLLLNASAASIVVSEAASSVSASSAEVIVAPSNKTGMIKIVAEMESWVQITDAEQNIVFSYLMPAGSERFISGKAPFKVIVGNAPKTKLFYLGKPVDLTPYAKADVATLELK